MVTRNHAQRERASFHFISFISRANHRWYIIDTGHISGEMFPSLLLYLFVVLRSVFLHCPIFMNIRVPDNKVTKYPQTRGYLYTPKEKRRGARICTEKHRGIVLPPKSCTSSAFEFLASGGIFLLPLPFVMIC